jgi:hypothetical protein
LWFFWERTLLIIPRESILMYNMILLEKWLNETKHCYRRMTHLRILQIHWKILLVQKNYLGVENQRVLLSIVVDYINFFPCPLFTKKTSGSLMLDMCCILCRFPKQRGSGGAYEPPQLVGHEGPMGLPPWVQGISL